MKYTNQEAFDRMVDHLAQMPGQCFSIESSQCMYRDEKGNACAVGALLTDREAEYMGEDPVEDIEDEALPESLQGLDRDMLVQMQAAHDSPSSWTGKKFTGWDKVANLDVAIELDMSKVAVYAAK